MPRFHLPKAKNKQKDYSVIPWTEDFRCEFPVQTVRKMMEEDNIPLDKLVNHLHFHCQWDRAKAELVKATIENELKLVRNDQEVNLVINLPFCVWRCFNCTNVMYEKSKNQDIYPYFFDALLKEIEHAKKIIEKKFYIVQNICFTGNIMALELDKIEMLLKAVNYSFSQIIVELGSPTFVTEEKLALLKKYNVSRIIFNALTFNTVTLRKLCRRFEFKDFYDAYKLIIGYGFETSIELVVGLLDEKELRLKRNLELACDLSASNIDIYSNHCRHIQELNITKQQQIIEQRKLLDIANQTMLSRGYKPYFLYCSEVENGCFENMGWSLVNQGCRFMKEKFERVSTIIGCGTQAESTLVKNVGNTRNYLKNPYDISLYVFGIDEVLEKKDRFFK